MSGVTRCGFVAIVGRPNVGKSTLLNHVLGQKLSITSRKPQTTRHQILGIHTTANVQMIFIDTPGMHETQPKEINRLMNKSAVAALRHVDLVIMVIDAPRLSAQDEWVMNQLKGAGVPQLLVINKIDRLDDKAALLPFLEQLAEADRFQAVVPLSALKGQNLDRLEQVIEGLLPEGEFIFPDDQLTDRSMRFLAAELIREKIMRQLGDELPYESTVEVEAYEEESGLTTISAVILVERSGQKKIVIGRGGERLKQIGTEARKDLERLVQSKVMLNLWVKVKSGWSDNQRALHSLGFNDADK